ncbi:MAG: glycoside hydrolase family 11 protein [Fibromonadales bacterium]|nr:glycoside hydrolase family 11 protein [Fibromonadales bacterium]
MKAFTKILGLALAASLPIFAQTTLTSSKQQTYNGYDYELWSENNTGTTSMTLTGDNGSGANAKGGTFTCSWQNSLNILFRSGKKWGMTGGPTPRSAGNISIDFDATWSSNDGARMLGVYGWAFYPSDSKPTKDEAGTSRNYSDQIEYYIIQDRGGYNPATGGDAAGGGKKYGEATIDGIVYEFYIADRINRWALTGNGDVTFKQYFSVPKTDGGKRTKGMISVSEHFKAWENAGMKMMDCRLYEVSMKVESYTNNRDGKGNATVTKNLLTIGGSSTPSSNSGGGITPSSSSQAKVQATTCKTPLITYPPSSVPSDPYTACFKHTNNKCYVCKISSEGEFEGNMNTCASGWVWDGTQLENNLTDGYWYQEVDCPATSSTSSAITSSSSVHSSSSAPALSSTAVSSSSRLSSSSAPGSVSSSSSRVSSSSSLATTLILSYTPLMHFSVRANGKELLVEASAPATVKIYDMKGQKMASFNVSSKFTSIDVSNMSGGVYYAKVYGVPDQKIRFVLK